MHRYRLKGEIEDKRREGIPSIEMKVDLRQHVKPEGRKCFLHSVQPEGRKCFLHSAQPEGRKCFLHSAQPEGRKCFLHSAKKWTRITDFSELFKTTYGFHFQEY